MSYAPILPIVRLHLKKKITNNLLYTFYLFLCVGSSAFSLQGGIEGLGGGGGGGGTLSLLHPGLKFALNCSINYSVNPHIISD